MSEFLDLQTRQFSSFAIKFIKMSFERAATHYLTNIFITFLTYSGSSTVHFVILLLI